MNRKLFSLLANAVVVLALTVLVLYILNVYNPMMGFTASLYSRVLECALCVLAAALGIVSYLQVK